MACPFARGILKASCDEAEDNGRQRISKLGRDDGGKSRQSSFEFTSLLMGEETEDAEDTQTLNLKHLTEAVLVLTNPPVHISKTQCTYMSSFAQDDLHKHVSEVCWLRSERLINILGSLVSMRFKSVAWLRLMWLPKVGKYLKCVEIIGSRLLLLDMGVVIGVVVPS
ncbi:hypothetical protein WN48_10086 [Eufriesea mexicana]|nr:hypothetical protein WN48_10086 [Eufriesea mexicana]